MFKITIKFLYQTFLFLRVSRFYYYKFDLIIFSLFDINMSLIIYHKNLKVLWSKRFSEYNGTEEYYKDQGNQMILGGLRENRKLKYQIVIYHAFISKIQNQKIYKISDEDKDYYIASILALWKLGVLDPDDKDSPIYIAPKRKRKSVSN